MQSSKGRIYAGSHEGLKALSVCLNEWDAQEVLEVDDADRENAIDLVIGDLWFSCRDLFRYQKLLYFLESDRPRHWPYVDRVSPIRENKHLLEIGGLHHFFVDSFSVWKSEREGVCSIDPFRVPYEREVAFSIFEHYTRNIWSDDPDTMVIDVKNTSLWNLACRVLDLYSRETLDQANNLSDLRAGTLQPSIAQVLKGRVV